MAGTDVFAKTHTVLKRSTPVVVPAGVLIGALITVVWFLRDDALGRIDRAEQRGEAVSTSLSDQDRRLIRLETQVGGMNETLAEIKAQLSQTNQKLDRVIERLPTNQPR